MKRKFILALATVIFAVFVSGEAFSALTVDVNHSHIKVDFLYHGSTVSVKGTCDKGTDLVIKVTSPEGHERLMKKGKAAGVLWMNVGQIAFEHVPSLYSLHSTREIKDILRPEEMERYGIGYQAVEEKTEITGISESDRVKWFAEFLKYKKASDLYWTSTGKIDITDKGDAVSYYTLVGWPYQAQPGVYNVTVYAVKGGRVVEQAGKSVVVEQVGVTKALAGMAKENGALYGAISIAIALGAGFGVGMVFRKGGGSH